MIDEVLEDAFLSTPARLIRELEEEIAPPAAAREIVVLEDGGLGIRYDDVGGDEERRLRELADDIAGRTYTRMGSGVRVRVPPDSQSVWSLQKFLEAAGNFVVGPAASRRMLEAQDRGAFMRALSRATDWPEYDLGPAQITSVSGDVPWGSQRAGVKYIELCGWKCLVADEMGTGKTVLAILAAVKAGVRKLLVVTPPSPAREQWISFLRAWLPNLRIVEMVSTKARKIGNADIVVVSHTSLRYDVTKDAEGEVIDKRPNPALAVLALAEFDGVIVDEAQLFINDGAMRTEAVANLVLANDPFFRLFMSGTLILNRIEEFTSNLKNAGVLRHFGNVTSLRRTYYKAGRARELNEKLRETGLLGRMKDHHGWDAQGRLWHIRDIPLNVAPMELRERFDDDKLDAEMVGRLRHRMAMYGWRLEPGMLRLRPKIYTPPLLAEMADAPRYWHAHDHATSWLKELAMETGGGYETFSRWEKAEALIHMNKLRQEVARQKRPAIRAYCQGVLASDEKLVIGVVHRWLADGLLEDFPGSVSIRGGVSSAARREARERFMHDPDTRLMLLNMESGGIALDGLQVSCSRIVAAERLWNHGKMEQYYDRVHRGGQTRQVIVDTIAAKPGVDEHGKPKDTIDQKFDAIIASKRGLASAALHGVSTRSESGDMRAEIVNSMLEDAA